MATKKVGSTARSSSKRSTTTTRRPAATRKASPEKRTAPSVAPDAQVATRDVSPVAAMAPMAKMPVTVTDEAVARRAYEIWCGKGYPAGQEEQNWLEAEAQLRSESTRRPARH